MNAIATEPTMEALSGEHMDAETAGDLETTMATMSEVQLGLLDPTGLPVAGVQAAAQVLDPTIRGPHF